MFGLIWNLMKFVVKAFFVGGFLLFVLLGVMSVVFVHGQLYPRDLPGDLHIVNVVVPPVSSSQSFGISFDLSRNISGGNKSVSAFVNGSGVVARDDLVSFDGRRVRWWLRAAHRGVVRFNVSLYENGTLIDRKEFSVYIPDYEKAMREQN